MFHYHDSDQSLTSFPLQTSAAFKSTTACWASLPEYPSSAPSVNEGCYEPGDYFFLATDALSQCILMHHEQASEVWKALLSVESEQAFRDCIEAWRRHRQIKNDDTSLVRIQILPD